MGHEELIGQKAPAFTLPNYDGTPYAVKPGETGTPIVLIFYPAAGTPACTTQACQMRDEIAAQKDRWGADKVQLIGISKSSVADQKNFVDKYSLTYPALSDGESGEVRQLYKIGKALFGLADKRVTVVIDKEGTVRATHDAMINTLGHKNFIDGWLTTFSTEGTKASE
ncbi:peroxiredoxin Q [Flagelloscypha sp. PMI_526]|nr:peroxiredoxin Q [Flagelloscypha sp. PMI_526]